MAFDQLDEEKLKERVIHINRVAKVVKGGRRFSFSGARRRRRRVGPRRRRPRQGQRGPRRPSARATTRLARTCSGSRSTGVTIPHDVIGHFGAGEVFLKPASQGTGVIAGGAVRAVVESAGIHDILTKCIGSSEPAQRRSRDRDGAQEPPQRASRSRASAASKATDLQITSKARTQPVRPRMAARRQKLEGEAARAADPRA